MKAKCFYGLIQPVYSVRHNMLLIYHEHLFILIASALFAPRQINVSNLTDRKRFMFFESMYSWWFLCHAIQPNKRKSNTAYKMKWCPHKHNAKTCKTLSFLKWLRSLFMNCFIEIARSEHNSKGYSERWWWWLIRLASYYQIFPLI